MESTESQKKSASKSLKKNNEAKKKIKITLQKKLKIELVLTAEYAANLTCDWLLKEAKRKFQETDKRGKCSSEIARIVALKASKDDLGLNYILTQAEETLEVLPEKISLQAYLAPAADSSPEGKKTTLQDFEICGCLGRGSFARVYLARKKQDGKFYALKQIKKGALNEREIQRLLDERDIMLMGRETGSIQLYSTFQTYCPGGDLFRFVSESDLGALFEREIKYFVKSVLKKLVVLHSKGIIHRDLKAQNLLLDLKGKIYLADFGLSKLVKNEDLNLTICGTPKYYAPELLQKEGYTFSIDYYNVGTLAYVLATGKAPFNNTKSTKQLFSEIIEKDAHIPKNLTPAFQDFLQKLLTKDPEKRLGSQGIHEIMNHVWLKDAPEEPPIRLSYTIIQSLVRKVDPEKDTAVLIDAKSWFQRSSTKKSTHIEGFSIQSDPELDESELDGLVLRDVKSDSAIESSKRIGFCSFASQSTTKIEISHQQDQKRAKIDEVGRKFDLEFLIPSAFDDQETTVYSSEFEELDENYNALELMNNARYQFNTNSNAKNKK